MSLGAHKGFPLPGEVPVPLHQGTSPEGPIAKLREQALSLASCVPQGEIYFPW